MRYYCAACTGCGEFNGECYFSLESLAQHYLVMHTMHELGDYYIHGSPFLSRCPWCKEQLHGMSDSSGTIIELHCVDCVQYLAWLLAGDSF